MVEKLGPARPAEVSAMTAPYPAIAYTAQKKLEEVLFAQMKYAASLKLSKNICFVGGVHMNCKANGLLAESELYENYFFQPAASDNGVCLGAAFLAKIDATGEIPKLPSLEHLYYGPSFTDEEIEKVLKQCKLDYEKSAHIARDVAGHIAKNDIVGWFQGRMEVGARALGGRSILANPLNPDARDHVNRHVKNREAWRPFCPSLKKESFQGYFETVIEKSPFMIVATRIHKEYLDVLPSCIHVDGTVRPQTVNKDINPLYWSVMNEFEKITGQSIIVNTSFNVQGEPIVMRPEEAIRCFYGSGIDVLAIGSFIVKK
jgi:carbamoyltransferase